MSKLKDFSQQQLNQFFGSITPTTNLSETKKLADMSFYDNMATNTANLNTSNSIDTINFNPTKINPTYLSPLDFKQIYQLSNTDPKLKYYSTPIDWSNLSTTTEKLTANYSKSGSAMKFDSNKLPVNLLSTEALLQITAVLKFGAEKYCAHNWRSGFAWSRPLAAAMRHIMAYNNGEDRDPESGLSHLAHAACCIMFLLEFEKTHPHLDDRYKPNVSTTSK